jgi:hypothetical protein
MFMSRLLIATGFAAVLALPAADAWAATQVLGLVASNGAPTELNCQGTTCRAHFSAFCLQQDRPAPSHGDRYQLAPTGDLTLIATTADGRRLRLPGGAYLEINSEIGFTSVEISLSKAKLAALGATAVAVEVGPDVSLLPMALAGDPNPQSADEIALATGPMRQVAAKTFEQPGAESDAARIASLMINALPDDEQEENAALRNGLWQVAVNDKVIAAATPAGVTMAQQMYGACRLAVESRSMFSMRNCLELRHADLLATANHKFWRDAAGY